MSRAVLLVALSVLFCGCGSSSDAAGIKAFIESCKSPVSGELKLGSMTGNTLKFSCADFNPSATKPKQEQS